MDELDQFKGNWEAQSDQFPQLSKTDISNILKRKSTSLVKWILIFGIIEFALWSVFSFAFNNQSTESLSEASSIKTFSTILEILSFAVLIYFIVQFYINYKRISVIDSTKALMLKILKTRKTVKLYIIINIALLFSGTIGMLFMMVNYDPGLITDIRELQLKNSSGSFYAQLIGITFLVLVIISILILLIYWLTYGTLLRRLKTNYKLLQDIEEENTTG